MVEDSGQFASFIRAAVLNTVGDVYDTFAFRSYVLNKPDLGKDVPMKNTKQFQFYFVFYRPFAGTASARAGQSISGGHATRVGTEKSDTVWHSAGHISAVVITEDLCYQRQKHRIRETTVT
jgi:hypothetical protein